MARPRRTKISAQEKVRVVVAVLAGELTGAEAARRHGVSAETVSKWKSKFLEAGAQGLEEIPAGHPQDGLSPE